MAATHIFTGTEPNGVMVIGGSGYTSDRVGGLIIKNRFPGSTRIFCVSNTAVTYRYIPEVVIFGVNSDISNTA